MHRAAHLLPIIFRASPLTVTLKTLHHSQCLQREIERGSLRELNMFTNGQWKPLHRHMLVHTHETNVRTQAKRRGNHTARQWRTLFLTQPFHEYDCLSGLASTLT